MSAREPYGKISAITHGKVRSDSTVVATVTAEASARSQPEFATTTDVMSAVGMAACNTATSPMGEATCSARTTSHASSGDTSNFTTLSAKTVPSWPRSALVSSVSPS